MTAILVADVSGRVPTKLPVTHSIRNDVAEPKISVDPLLLNPGDQFTILVLVDGFGKDVGLSARIVGIREIGKAIDRKTPERYNAFSLPQVPIVYFK